MIWLMLVLLTPPVLSGTYTCTGVQGADQYETTLTIEKKGNTFFIQWINADGPQAQGIGMQNGDRLSVAFITTKGVIGIASYHLAIGSLNGTWAVGGEVYPETCMVGRPGRA